MEIVLSLKHQDTINGYLVHAYPFSILNTYPEYHNYLTNNYVQCFGYLNESGFLTFDYEDGIGYNHLYHKSDPLEVNWIPYHVGLKLGIAEVIKRAIDLNHYVVIFTDEYFLKSRPSYKQKHFLHEIMITGYKNKVFTYYAFDENFKLTFDECPQLSLAKAYKKGRHLVLPEALDWIGKKSIIFMKPRKAFCSYDISKGSFIHKLKAYNSGIFQKEYDTFIKNSEHCFIGVHNTQAIIQCVNDRVSAITYPAIHSWYESKRNLLSKMRTILFDVSMLTNLFDKYETDIVRKADMIRMVFLKYRRSGKINADNTLTLLNELYSREKDIIGQILESINES